ncbi:MAG: hypothetical protein Q9174_002351 [Haloplaca sp. 1 TL-2023]
MATMRQRSRRSHSLDSGLDSKQQQGHPGVLQNEGPQSSGYIWSTYFDDDMLAYQGLDEEWIDGSLSGSEAAGREDSEDEDSCTGFLQDMLEQATDGRTPSTSDAQQLDLPRGPPQDRIETLDKNKGLEAHPEPIANASHPNHCEPWVTRTEAQDRETVDGPDELWSDNDAEDSLLDALDHETDNFLGTGLDPVHSSPISGVEAAKNAYNDGFLSTSVFHLDCLPPALLCTKPPSSPGVARGPNRLPLPKTTARMSTIPATSDEHEHADTDGPLPVVKRRNISERDQLRRLNQPPLSAIYEESSDTPPPIMASFGFIYVLNTGQWHERRVLDTSLMRAECFCTAVQTLKALD